MVWGFGFWLVGTPCDSLGYKISTFQCIYISTGADFNRFVPSCGSEVKEGHLIRVPELPANPASSLSIVQSTNLRTNDKKTQDKIRFVPRMIERLTTECTQQSTLRRSGHNQGCYFSHFIRAAVRKRTEAGRSGSIHNIDLVYFGGLVEGPGFRLSGEVMESVAEVLASRVHLREVPHESRFTTKVD